MTYYGTTSFSGTVSGRVHIHRQRLSRIERVKASDSDAEIERFLKAKRKAEERLLRLSREAKSEYGSEAGEIFEVHQMMLDDPDYAESVCGIIKSDEANCETAVYDTCALMRGMFENIESDYIRARYEDICDVSEQLLDVLCGAHEESEDADGEPRIIVCSAISCMDLFILRRRAAAVVSELGTRGSHQEALAGIMGLPYICGADGILRDDLEGARAVINGGEIRLLTEV